MTNFENRTIDTLFDSFSDQYIIPDYQRAYSWEGEQLQQFVEDIKDMHEHASSGTENDYFYGTLLLEIEADHEFNIIDGQQRLTTLIIFMRCVIDRLSKEDKKEADRLEKKYLQYDGKIRFRPTASDRDFFDKYIINNSSLPSPKTKSQERIKEAKKAFDRSLKKLTPDVIKKYVAVIEKAKINVLKMKGKRESALLFELQNNRGKHLTLLEKLKAFFMYQMYCVSTKEKTDEHVKNVADIFGNINNLLFEVEENWGISDEDLLRYHCHAYSEKHYDWRGIGHIAEELKGVENTEKAGWIIRWLEELKSTCAHLKEENIKNIHIQKLFDIGIDAHIFPFIIRGLKYIEDEHRKNIFYATMEFFLFRVKITNRQANIRTRIRDYGLLNQFEGDTEWLLEGINDILQNSWYWSEDHMEGALDGWMDGNPLVKYILKNYEIYLHHTKDAIQYTPYKKIESYDTDSLEHIMPRALSENTVTVSGFGEFADDNERNEYLACLGNLLLLSGRKNTSLGNKNFEDKAREYGRKIPKTKITENRQQGEMENFYDTKSPRWGKEEIDKRHAVLKDFVLQRWNKENIEKRAAC